MNNLAAALQQRFEFQRPDHTEDLDEAIDWYRKSNSHIPIDDARRSILLHNLSQALTSRFDKTRRREDLDEAIAIGHASISLSRPSHSLRHVFITNTAEKLASRFALFDSKQDLDEEIRLRQDLLTHLPSDHPAYIKGLTVVIFRLQARFKRYEQLGDIDRIIECLWLTFANLPIDNAIPHMGCLVALAAELERRHSLLHQQEDLDDAITLSYHALDLSPEDNSLIVGCLIRMLRWRFQRSGDLEDLEEVIRFGWTAISIPSLESIECFMFTSGLAADLFIHFDSLKCSDDLEDSIALGRRARDICPSDHPEKYKLSLGLAIRIMKRFTIIGRIEDLQESIFLHLETLKLSSSAHIGHVIATFVPDIFDGVKKLLEKLSDTATFEDGLHMCSQALEELKSFTMHPESRHDRHLSNTAGILMACLTEHARLRNINETTGSLYRKLALSSISNLGDFSSPVVDLAKRFLEVGRTYDLDKTVILHRNALTLFPSGHDHHAICVNNLGTSLMLCFDQTNSLEYLNEAVDCYREALESSQPQYHNEIAINFVQCLLVRFGYIGNCADLVEAMVIYRETLLHRGAQKISYIPSKDYPASLQNRLGRLDSTKTFNEAVEVCCEAVILAPPGNPDRPMASGGAEEIFDTGVKTHKDLLSWSKKLQEHESESLLILSAYQEGYHGPAIVSAEFLFILARLCIVQHDWGLAFSIYDSSSDHGPVATCFRAALIWVRLTREHRHHSTHHAYSRALSLSERLISLRPTIESQYNFLTSNAARELSSHAASYSIEEGNLEASVEMLERGRRQLWSKLQTYRHPFNPLLTSVNLDDESAFLTGVGSELERLTTFTLDETFGPVSISNVNQSFDRDSAPHRSVLNFWEGMITSMRKGSNPPGLLSLTPFSTLREAAIEGPVIIVSLSQYRSDALIIRHTGAPILVPLDKELPRIVSKLCATLFEIKNSRLDMVKSNSRFPATRVQESVMNILQTLWQHICAPVVDELKRIQTKKLSRIWWCPTGALIQLPLHASGPYVPGKENLYDLFISSYTSSLSSLIQARKTAVPESSTSAPRILAIGQSDSLPQVYQTCSHLNHKKINFYYSGSRRALHSSGRLLRQYQHPGQHSRNPRLRPIAAQSI